MTSSYVKPVQALYRSWSRRAQAYLPPSVLAHRIKSSSARNKWLLISLDKAIPQSQIFPFYFYRDTLLKKHSVDFFEVKLSQFESGETVPAFKPDAVFFQFWIDKTPQQARALAQRIRTQFPDAVVVFLDSFAPADLRYADALNDYIDRYVKKHALANEQDYLEGTYGDTNLMDWYGKYFELEHEPQQFRIPERFFAKLHVGPSFLTAPYLLPLFWTNTRANDSDRHIDLHIRLGGTEPDNWYGSMRRLALEKAGQLQEVRCSDAAAVSKRQYLRELKSSKICFSPFGYGEVCWRDYEAIAFGAALIKPHMDHMAVAPRIFLAQKTYIPCAWDFSDLQDAVHSLLADEPRRREIASSAFNILREYVCGDEIPDFLFAVASEKIPQTPLPNTLVRERQIHV